MMAYLAAAAALSASCLFLGITAQTGKNRKTERRLFLLMSLSLALFLLSAGFSVSSVNLESVVLWYRISGIGFSSFYALNLHFYLSLVSGRGIKMRHFLVYIPVPVVLVSTFISESLFHGFIFTGGMWRFLPAYRSPWFWVYLFYYFPYTASTVFLLFMRADKTKRKIHHRQAVVLSVLILMTLLIGSATDFIFPRIPSYSLPPLGPLTVSLYVMGLWFILLRYNFMDIGEAFPSDEIINNIREMVFILDPELMITSANNFAVKILSLDNRPEKSHIYFPSLGDSPGIIEKLIDDLRLSDQNTAETRIIFRNSDKFHVTETYFSVIADQFHDISGFLVISRLNHVIDEFIKKYHITKREMEIIENCVSGKSSREIADKLFISERTVETHLTNIFQKTGTSNRIELFNTASAYGIIRNT